MRNLGCAPLSFTPLMEGLPKAISRTWILPYLPQPSTDRPPFPPVRTTCGSMAPAVGSASRPAAWRTCRRGPATNRSHVPSSRQASACWQTGRQGGQSGGKRCQAQPARAWWKRAWSNSCLLCWGGRPQPLGPHKAPLKAIQHSSDRPSRDGNS